MDEDDDEEGDLLEPGVRVWGLKKMALDMPNAEARAVLTQHDGLLRHVIRRYRLPRTPQGLSAEDQYAIGQCVLLQAHNSFDPTTGFQFSTWAVRLLEQSFSELARKTRGQTRNEQLYFLRARDGEDLTEQQQAYVERYMQRGLVSLDVPRTRAGPTLSYARETEGALYERIADDKDDEAEHVERDLREWLYAKLANGILTQQERTIVSGYLKGRTFRQIGASAGVTRQRAQQVWVDAVAKLKTAAKRETKR